MKRLLLIPLAALLFVACEDDREKKNREKVEACFAKGGDPEYTVDKHGNIEHFFVCEMP